MGEFRLKPAAEDDLGSIWTYSKEHWNENLANRYIDTLVCSFEQLAKNPRLALGCDHIRKGYRRWPVESHIVYFKETNYGILIVRVLHERMHALNHLS